MRHLGIRPEGDIPKSAKREYRYTKRVAGKDVRYYECWIDYNENEVKKVFKDNEPPSKSKILAVEKIVRNWKD